MAALQTDWQGQRSRAADELEALAGLLVKREEMLVDHDQQNAVLEHHLACRHEEVEALRQVIQLKCSQMEARENAFNEEHAQQMLAMRQREKSLEDQLSSLADLRQRWNQRRRQEVESQQAERALGE